MRKRSNHELFQRYPDNPILSVEDWPYKANSAFNTAAIDVDVQILLLTRVGFLYAATVVEQKKSDIF